MDIKEMFFYDYVIQKKIVSSFRLLLKSKFFYDDMNDYFGLLYLLYFRYPDPDGLLVPQQFSYPLLKQPNQAEF